MRILVFLILILSSTPAWSSGPSGLHAYVAAAYNFQCPGSVRVGWKEWEFGSMSQPHMLGAMKRHYFSSKYYSGFGFLVMPLTNETHLGFVSSIGFDTPIFWGLNLRGEFVGLASFNGFVAGRANLGLAYWF